MMGRTHAIGGVASLWLLYLLFLGSGITTTSDPANLGALAAFAALGALLPDLDAQESSLKHLTLLSSRRNGITLKPFALPATLLARVLGHRGLSHSAMGLGVAGVVIGLPLSIALGWQSAVALLLGYASHLLLDACTKSGIPFLYPDRNRRFALPPVLRVTTGSAAEEAVFALLALLAFGLFIPLLLGSALL